MLGGFTTFSTFAWDSFTLGRNGHEVLALMYVLSSVVGGLLAASLGYSLGRALSL